MKKVFLLFLIISINCKKPTHQSINIKNNQTLLDLYYQDQEDRQNENLSWKLISKRDSFRRNKVNLMLKNKEIKTALDYSNAAMIFQHGLDTISSFMAIKMMTKSISIDSTQNKWLLAAAIDRHLIRKNKPQIYGTQYIFINDKWQLCKSDTTKITDKQRIEYGVETLLEQKNKVKRLNSKNLIH